MKKFASVKSIFLAAMFAILFSGCSSDGGGIVDESPILKGYSLEDQAGLHEFQFSTVNEFNSVAESAEFKELEAVKEELMSSLAQKRISKKSFQKAMQSGDIEKAAKLLKMDKGKLKSMNDRLLAAIEALKANHQAVRELATTVQPEVFARRVEIGMENYEQTLAFIQTGEGSPGALKAPTGTMRAEETVDCDYGPYTACLIGAGIASGSTGPLAVLTYGIGAYVCLCGFCEGGWVDRVCEAL